MPAEAPSRPVRHTGKQKITLLLLMLVALGIVFLLPKYVSEPWFADGTDDAPTPPDTSANVVSPSTAAEKTRYRQDSQKVLAEIISLRDRLSNQQVERWAEIEFRQAMNLIETGDQQYSYGEYRQSLQNYEQVLTQLEELENLGQAKLATALADGLAALESLNTVIASASSELASAIAPERTDVQELAVRVGKLPQMASLLETGDQARAVNKLLQARTAYEEAVNLDPLHKRAANSLSGIRTEITDSVFRGHMSRGYAFLENNEFEQAINAFNEAGKVYPGRAAVRQALAQVENRQSQLLVSGQVQRATELESREEWREAVSVYESLLEQDPSLTEVKARLLTARVRSDLDARLEQALADPLKLSESSMYRKAYTTLSDARGIPDPGAKLNDQVATLDRLLRLSVTPIDVVFQSDNMTDVTLFRITKLGRFETTSMQLKPGRYVAGGTRQGFRDVRIEFTITGEPLDAPIVVRCMEQI